MEGFSSNLNDTFTSTRGCAEPMCFPQLILPFLPLYNAQWWGYESLTAIVLVWSRILKQFFLQKRSRNCHHLSCATFGSLIWRSRSQHYLAAKSCLAHNFVIWSCIWKLFYINNHHIEAACTLRSRSQHDIASKSGLASNFVIYIHNLKLLHKNYHNIETTCHAQHFGH